MTPSSLCDHVSLRKLRMFLNCNMAPLTLSLGWKRAPDLYALSYTFSSPLRFSFSSVSPQAEHRNHAQRRGGFWEAPRRASQAGSYWTQSLFHHKLVTRLFHCLSVNPILKPGGATVKLPGCTGGQLFIVFASSWRRFVQRKHIQGHKEKVCSLVRI